MNLCINICNSKILKQEVLNYEDSLLVTIFKINFNEIKLWFKCELFPKFHVLELLFPA